jgi:hypothetical protein
MVVVLIFVALFVFERLDGPWAFAMPPYLFGSFAAASVGSHLCSQAWTARKRVLTDRTRSGVGTFKTSPQRNDGALHRERQMMSEADACRTAD